MENKEQGWVKLFRKVIRHPIFTSRDDKLFKTFIWCLLRAQHQEIDFFFNHQLIHLKAGEFITGRESAAAELGYAPKTFDRKVLDLQMLQILTRKVTRRFSIISIINWKAYQGSLDEDDQPNGTNMPVRCTSDALEMATYKNVKNEKNEKDICSNRDSKGGIDWNSSITEEADASEPVVDSPSKKATNPETKIFIDFFFQEFKKRTGNNYEVKGAKDGSLVSQMLKTHGLEKLKSLTIQNFETKNDWVKNTLGFSIGTLYSQINQLASTGKTSYSEKNQDPGRFIEGIPEFIYPDGRRIENTAFLIRESKIEMAKDPEKHRIAMEKAMKEIHKIFGDQEKDEKGHPTEKAENNPFEVEP